MAPTLSQAVLDAFRSGDRGAVREALGRVVNRAARLMTEAHRQRLTEFWKTLSAAHYDAEGLDLAPDLREQRGYLEAVVHLAKAVRDQSDDVEAIQQVKKCVHGPPILAALKLEGTIRHGELAERLGISAPSLTQAIRGLADSRAITSTVHGKFKYYSLTPLGRLVATKLEKSVSLEESVAAMRRSVANLFLTRQPPAQPVHDELLSAGRWESAAELPGQHYTVTDTVYFINCPAHQIAPSAAPSLVYCNLQGARPYRIGAVERSWWDDLFGEASDGVGQPRRRRPAGRLVKVLPRGRRF